MIYWAQLLHFYQPPTQTPVILEKIGNECYKPLLAVFRQYPHARATMNINGVLLDLWHNHGHDEIIDGIRELGERGQIEFTGSGKYHPLLPLIPESERKRQIELNLVTLRGFLGKDYLPKGFFPPEMAYSREIISEVIATGHRWIILSGIACSTPWTVDKVYQIEQGGKRLAVLFRDDILSNRISFQQTGAKDFLEQLKQVKSSQGNAYVITAMDAETYGHHIKNYERLFLAAVYEQLQQSQEIRMVPLSQLLEIFPLAEAVSPKPSSWSTTAEDIAIGNPYPLWQDKNSEIHRLQWQHLRLCLEMVNKAQECLDNDESWFFSRFARGLLDQAEHSDQFWWANRPPRWNINLIHLGLLEQCRALVNAYLAINKSGVDSATKRDYYRKLLATRDIANQIVDRLFSPL